MTKQKEKKQIHTKLSVYDLSGKVVDNIQLDESIFDGQVNHALLYEAKKMYEANVRTGTASCKSRGEVSGGGRKPWRQKGTGRARVGSSRNPIWRHGGVTFGPKPRDYSYHMTKKALKKALLSTLNARITENMIMATVKIDIAEPKTKEFAAVLSNLKVEGKTLVVVDEVTEKVKRVSRNIAKVTLMEGRNINARDVLLNASLVIEKTALEKLAERLK